MTSTALLLTIVQQESFSSSTYQRGESISPIPIPGVIPLLNSILLSVLLTPVAVY